MLPYNPGLRHPARVLRRTMTDAERLLWSRVHSSSFRKLHVISIEQTALCNIFYSLRFLAPLELTVLLCHYVNALLASRSGRFRSIVRNRLAATSLIFTHPIRSCLNEKSCSGKIRISKLETRNKFEYQMTKGMVND
jgi:hypothetical protein